MKNRVLIPFLAFALMHFVPPNVEKIRYFLTPTISVKPDHVQPHILGFQDELSSDTLFQVMSREGYPLSYFRELTASVCFDNKCRLLDVVVYWNITGRYLGFELPEKEFLSKADHEPFTDAEYKRLNELLADRESPLGGLSYEELVPKPNITGIVVDGVSSATAKDVLEYIVEGAAYTTFKMWHFVYGETRDKVTKLTERSLSPELILKILESSDPDDKLWALNHINGYIDLTPELQNTILQLIYTGNYNLQERAVNAISAKDLRSGSLQLSLVERFSSMDFSLKKLILNKLKDAPELDVKVSALVREQLKSLNGELVGIVLDLYKKHKIYDTVTCRQIAELLANDNNFISQKAFKFLETANVRDEMIQKQLDHYKTKKN